MLISFQLTMPNNSAWNGNWTGEGQPYFIIKNLKKASIGFLNGKVKDSFYYDFEDGWGASVVVEIINAKEARKRRAASQGFCSYDWMVKELIKFGRIIPRQERIRNNKLREAEQYCNDNDKSDEFTLEYMQDFAGVDLDAVLEFLQDEI